MSLVAPSGLSRRTDEQEDAMTEESKIRMTRVGTVGAA
jgi:hypothetical protein